LSEVLIGIGGDANKAEAKGLLEDALKSEDAYYRDQARKMLDDLK
jgi:hypothetical protein